MFYLYHLVPNREKLEEPNIFVCFSKKQKRKLQEMVKIDVLSLQQRASSMCPETVTQSHSG